MGAFDKVIGYEQIKDELLQVCDMLKNREVYESLGAKLPRGILLHGDPGLGKTLMAECFIEESGLKSYIVRRAKGKEEFVKHVANVFHEAKENAPAIVLLDDMDKFANEDEVHQNAEEYVAVQAGIDACKGYEVLVIATTNDMNKLPESLIRPGRFDKKIAVNCPTNEEADALITHFLSDKRVGADINVEDLAKMMKHISCAELESVLNNAAIAAASKRRGCIYMDDLVESVLQSCYGMEVISHNKQSDESIRKLALHEAGHLVVAEVLEPESIGLVSIRSREVVIGGSNGFVKRCKPASNRRKEALITLAGKAATELYYSETCASGCSEDLEHAYSMICDGICESGTHGLGFIQGYYGVTQDLKRQVETIVRAEMERYMFRTREILLKNRAFLEKVTDALIEKEILLFSDIREIRESVEVVENGSFS